MDELYTFLLHLTHSFYTSYIILIFGTTVIYILSTSYAYLKPLIRHPNIRYISYIQFSYILYILSTANTSFSYTVCKLYAFLTRISPCFPCVQVCLLSPHSCLLELKYFCFMPEGGCVFLPIIHNISSDICTLFLDPFHHLPPVYTRLPSFSYSSLLEL